MSRDEDIEIMARALFDRDHNGPFAHKGITRLVFGRDRITYDEVVKGVADGVYTESALSTARAEAEAALTALEASDRAVVPGWQPIESAPKGRKVVVAYRNSLGHWRQVMARYFEAETFDSDETDDGFAPEGWYEESDTHEHLLRTDEPPTYWRPLLPFPDDGKAPAPEGSAEAQSAVANPSPPMKGQKG